MIGGVRVTRVSLSNAETVERLGIAAGDRVVIALVADIIPQVTKVEEKERRATGPGNATAKAAQFAAADCLSDAPGCRDQFVARAAHFASKAGLNITGLGPGRLRKLVEAGLVHDLPSLFRLKSEEVAAVPGFGAGSARRLTAALRRVGRPHPFRLVAALGIPGVGPVAARRLAKEFDSLDELLYTQQEQSEGGAASQNVRSFFGSQQGQELLKGLREVDLLQ
jgi:DNA ligase (NAD+)